MIKEIKPQEFKLFSSKWKESSTGEIVSNLEHQSREEDNERLSKIDIDIQKVSLCLYEAMIYLTILYGEDPNDHIKLNFSVKIGSLKKCFEYLDNYLQHICLDHDKKPKRYKCAFFTKNDKNEIEELSEHSFTFEAKYYCIAKKISLIYGFDLLSRLNKCYYSQKGHSTGGMPDQYWNYGDIGSYSFYFHINGRNEDQPNREDKLLIVVYEESF